MNENRFLRFSFLPKAGLRLNKPGMILRLEFNGSEGYSTQVDTTMGRNDLLLDEYVFCLLYTSDAADE